MNFFLDGDRPLWHIPASAALGFALLLFLLRVAGKRTVAKFNMYDMILTFTVGSVLASFIVLERVKFVDAALGLTSIIGIDYLISLAVIRSQTIRNMVKSSPTLLVFKGELQGANMRRERIVRDEILMLMRQHGIERLDDITAMVLEPSGDIAVFTGESNGTAHALRRSGVEISN
ncbi:DUF421 domain-containing protein [Palleronia sp. LCG004]|uniref:DUF421 domain-containing protein n=1 Tax=Palleronia sp. LCG004 TaxID=3079304 RepID=UPI00294240F3|nr:YetF domain-containing protein [Palleronia sp. LCG004]WOI56971.1 DUF421 domain-containing protein [Palleronia sp. LCG004]